MSEATATADRPDLAATNREVARKILTLLGTEEQFDYFADDVVMEFPYGPSLGQPARFDGKQAAAAYTRKLTERIGRIRMRDMTFSSVEGQPETVFIEYSGDVNTPGGHSYLQTYFNKMTFAEGKLVHMREVWDTKLIVDAAAGAFDGAASN
jgi:ketosteroid isomerase-like protein